MPDWLAGPVARLADNPWLQGLLAALATFILEDPTTVGCGLLVAEGRMLLATAFVGVSAGIAIGDVGLYGLGRAFGARIIRWGWVSEARLAQAQGWFDRNLITAVLLSRFLPGMRLPTYVGAGILRAPFHRFVVVAVLASLGWTALLLWLSISLGEAVLPLLGRVKWPVAGGLLLVLVLVQRRTARRFQRSPAAAPSRATVSRFEFWSPWVFYFPVGLYWVWLSLRYRGVMLPTAANPSIFAGGFIGESKSAILDLVPRSQRRWISPYTVFERSTDAAEADRELRAATDAMERAGLGFPVVAKPDVGQRGAGIQLLGNPERLDAYLRGFPRGERIVLQRPAGGAEHDMPPAPSPIGIPGDVADAREAGVLYWRDPDSGEGRIFSITLKLFPAVTGDGEHTLRELIERDPRARHIAALYLKRHADDANRIVEAGRRRQLVFAGNHCQGAIFRNGTALATSALLERLDAIARAMPEFWFGRFDIRFHDLASFFRGEDVEIIEINGAGSEATHIWDASVRLGEAYRTLFQQFRILFRIGAANRRRGHPPLGLIRVLREALAYRRLARSYPATH